MKPAQIAFIPFAPTLGNVPENLQAVISLIQKAQKKNSVDVIFFPELALCGYLLENLAFSCALSLPDDLPGELLELSENCEIHIGSLIKENGKIYNAQIILYGKKIIHIHRKIYLPSYGLFDESRYFTAGEKLSCYEGRLGRSAILICEDAFHPALAYALYMAKAQHIFVPSCSPARGVNLEANDSPDDDPAQNFPGTAASYRHWKRRLEVYAESFGQFFYYLNRGGCEDGVFFDGRGLVVSAGMNSQEITLAPNEELSVAKIEPSEIESATTLGGPHVDENFQINMKFINEARKIRDEQTF